MHNIAILSYPNAALFELGCAVELFALSRPEFEHWYKCEVISFSVPPLPVTGGLQLQAKTVATLEPYSMLVIPSWPVTTNHTVPPELGAEILRFYQQGKRIISFCSGAFLLAELGLLDGRKATTHWRYAGQFKQRFPKVNYVDDVLYVYQEQLGCSAGSAAALDLGIEIIRQDYGYQMANQVARRLVLSAHRKGGQSQFVETPLLQQSGLFTQALDWASANLTAPISIDTLAGKAGMSRRTFDRKFRSTFNMTAQDWLIQQRLERVKALLENSSGQIEHIAALAGFESAITLRYHFRKILGVSPVEYRQQFRAENKQEATAR